MNGEGAFGPLLFSGMLLFAASMPVFFWRNACRFLAGPLVVSYE